MPASDFSGAHRVLTEAGVEFIVVGGLAAVLNGAPVNTFDLDIVHSRSEENVARLAGALESIERFGPLDVRGTIGRGLGYDELAPLSIEMEIGAGIRVRVLGLATIIALKEELAGEKDTAVLPVLRRTREQKRRE
jgi:predicted nucleotidyltransferase